jgi:hypothetical protein
MHWYRVLFLEELGRNQNVTLANRKTHFLTY